MDTSQANLITRLLRSGLAALLLLAIVNDSMRYVLAWSQIYLSIRDTNEVLGSVILKDPEERAPAANAASAAASRFGVTVESYGQEIEQSSTSRTVRLSAVFTNPVEHTIFAAPARAATWKWPVRYWWHANAAPTVRYTWDSQVVLQSSQQ